MLAASQLNSFPEVYNTLVRPAISWAAIAVGGVVCSRSLHWKCCAWARDGMVKFVGGGVAGGVATLNSA